ncbi:MAG: DUF2520 domain-containing protein [Deltaproteobacteria bacterium]|jgi:predicted short-subunit dehydrogenase-like oxidoreductase (DUF2520 family)|nr:DUF2520 domain-containing protein [Deltaproteobacteria bacterium]
MKIGFIGAGKVGHSLGKYFAEKRVALSGYFSRTLNSAEEAARFTNSQAFSSPLPLFESSDLIFLTVPDGAIGPVWENLKQSLQETLQSSAIKDTILGHCSGSLSSDIFEKAKDLGFEVISLHPLMAIPDKLESYKLLSKAVFSIEGTPRAVETVSNMINSLGNQTHVLHKDQKTLYHCAASFVSNFGVALAQIGAEMFKSCGLEAATPALFQLMLANANSIAQYGPVHALTGPIERGDEKTIAAHLRALKGQEKEVYRLLGQKLVEISKVKHPEKDYGPLLKVLNEA